MLKLCEVFVKKFIDNEVLPNDPNANNYIPTTEVDVIRHKLLLYKFFDLYTEKITDHKIWRLYGRMKS
jgi:hypothetical protein